MKLTSKHTLKALMHQRDVSHRDLAQAVGKTHGFIDHLVAGRRDTCKPATAEAIARWLQVPLEVLFVPNVPNADARVVQQRERAAA